MDPGLSSLCAELERLYDLEGLRRLTRDVLGTASVSGSDVASAYAKALAQRCVESDAVVALCDALIAGHDDLDPRVLELRSSGILRDDDLDSGDQLGPFLILRRLGQGRTGSVYVARHEGGDVRLKVLRHSAAIDRVGLHRFLTASRLSAAIGHPGLPSAVTAGDVDGRYYLAQQYVEGQTLAARIERTGALHLDELRPLFRGVLDALAALHSHRLVHGGLRLENVLIGTAGDGSEMVVLLDGGAHHLGAPAAPANGRTDRLEMLGSPKSLSPEQVEGRLPDARSDLYSFGALLFEGLTGRPVFDGTGVAQAFLAHLTRDPPLPSLVAPAGWVRPDVDDFVTHLLSKNPANRPGDAAALSVALETLGHGLVEPIGDDELDGRIRDLLDNPGDALSDEALVAAVREGGSAERVADAFRLAADLVDPEEGPRELAVHRRLLSRAARLYATTLDDPQSAERLYARLSSLDPDDAETVLVLKRLRKKLGKHEEIVEELLARCEAEDSSTVKAMLWDEIGRIYVTELDDREQALVAFTQAFCEDPTDAARAEEIERLASRGTQAWADIMQSCMDRAHTEMPEAAKHALLLQMATWYDEKISRPDLALPCYNAVLGADSGNEHALSGLTALYRKTHQWSELSSILLMHADAQGTPLPKSRDLRTEAAEILELRLSAVSAARELYERVIAQDPTHDRAGAALARMYEQAGHFEKLAELLEERARNQTRSERLATLFQLGETEELRLSLPEKAIPRYRAILEEDPAHLDALQALDRCFSQTGRFRDLVQNLEEQIARTATPRQKVQLWERVASVWDEEFLDHANAAEAWENVLDLDPEHDSALTNLARQYRLLERWNDVVVIYDRHLELLVGDEARWLEKSLALGHVLAEGLEVHDRAVAVYEKVLERFPENTEVLEALAKLRLGTGKTDDAVRAIEQLAKNAETPEERAEHYIRAAQAFEAAGDRDAAIERYKLAVEANPNDRTAAMVLRGAYVARGDVTAAAELLEQEIKRTEGEAARAKLSGELAALYRDRLKNEPRAESWAKVTLDLDPTNLDALRVMGDIAFDGQRWTEAARYFEQVVNRTDALSPVDAVRVPIAHAECLLQSGAPKKAVEVAERLIARSPDDVNALLRTSEIIFEHGAPERSFELHWDLSQRIAEDITVEQRAGLIYRLGESARRADDPSAAIDALEKAARLDATSTRTLSSLALAYGALGQWDVALQTMYRRLELEKGAARVDLLIEMGDLAAEKLSDSSYAAKIFLAALAEKPDERRVLTKLMQLYSTERDWSRLVKVILKLADFVDDEKQKAKYLLTAGRIAWKELGDVALGSQIFARALQTDPENESAAREGVEVHAAARNAEALKEALKRQVKIASDANDKEQMVRSLTALAELYLRHFHRVDQAIAVYEAAEEVDPNDPVRAEILGELYAADPATYGAKAIAVQLKIIDRDPFRVSAHRMLRKLHTEAQRPDGAWCACQTLAVLGQAEPDEERFYLRMRNEDGVTAKSRFTEHDFHALVLHPRANPLLTALFTVIQPAVVKARTKSYRELGFGAEHVLDPQQREFASAQVLPYAADILGMQCPTLFYDPNDYGELSFLHAPQPGIAVGTAVIGVALPIQTLSFLAARHLTYYRQGLWVRQLVPTTTGLKAWLFAAIALMAPAFPVPSDIAGPAKDALVALDRAISGPARDHLLRVVSKLIQESSALDLKQWLTGIDLTADRAGLILSDDLASVIEAIRASDPASSSVSAEGRVEEIYRYAVSEQYLGARECLGIAIG